MTDSTSQSSELRLPAKQAYALAILCLAVGLLIGYFYLGVSFGRVRPPAVAPNTAAASRGTHPPITFDQMKQMAAVQASSLIEKSKSDPKNAALLIQIAQIYESGHQFKEAVDYYQRALKLDPKNTAARTALSSSLFYSGDVDGALAQLNEVLKYDPKNVNALFNLGMIKYRAKKDSKGAIAAWDQLLKSNPNLDRKAVVEQMIAQAKADSGTKN